MITVQVGQCGNQIGEKFFETLVADCFDQVNLSQKHLEKAGNHLSLSDFKKLNSNYVSESMERFFTQDEAATTAAEKYSARSVLIDMESKVINKLLKRKSNENAKIDWSFRETNSYSQKKGSGNNW